MKSGHRISRPTAEINIIPHPIPTIKEFASTGYIRAVYIASSPGDRVEQLLAIFQRAASRVRDIPRPDLHDVADALFDAQGLPLQ